MKHFCFIKMTTFSFQLTILHNCMIFYFHSSPHIAGQTKASRLCKAGFLHRFKELAKVTKMYQLLNFASYAAAKQCCRPYQTAKHAFRQHCAQIGIGEWIKVPSEIDRFQKWRTCSCLRDLHVHVDCWYREKNQYIAIFMNIHKTNLVL